MLATKFHTQRNRSLNIKITCFGDDFQFSNFYCACRTVYSASYSFGMHSLHKPIQNVQTTCSGACVFVFQIFGYTMRWIKLNGCRSKAPVYMFSQHTHNKDKNLGKYSIKCNSFTTILCFSRHFNFKPILGILKSLKSTLY